MPRFFRVTRRKLRRFQQLVSHQQPGGWATLMLFIAFGFVFILLGCSLPRTLWPAAVIATSSNDTLILSYSWGTAAFGMLLGLFVVLGGVFVSTDDQLYNWILVATGIAIFIISPIAIISESIRIEPDSCVVYHVFSPFGTRYAFQDYSNVFAEQVNLVFFDLVY